MTLLRRKDGNQTALEDAGDMVKRIKIVEAIINEHKLIFGNTNFKAPPMSPAKNETNKLDLAPLAKNIPKIKAGYLQSIKEQMFFDHRTFFPTTNTLTPKI